MKLHVLIHKKLINHDNFFLAMKIIKCNDFFLMRRIIPTMSFTVDHLKTSLMQETPLQGTGPIL